MSDYETKLKMAEINKDLAELWIDEVDLYEIHINASRESDSRCVGAVNAMHRQLDRCKTILHGEKLRKVFGYE